MGWNNPPVKWSTLERQLSGEIIRDPLTIDHGDGGDTPAWTRKRAPYEAPTFLPQMSTVDYAELHCHSNFSFLDGASHPEELVAEAARLGLTGLALTDHDGFYGVVRFSEAAAEHRLPTVFGAELSLGLPGPRRAGRSAAQATRTGEPDPHGTHLLVLARGPQGYAKLSTVMAEAHLEGGEKGRPSYHLEQLAAELKDHVLVLTGCRKGAVPWALREGGEARAGKELEKLTALFGVENVVVELTDHRDPLDGDRNDALAALAADHRLRTVATNNVHYATPDRRLLATTLAAVRARRSLDEIDGWLPAAATAHLRSGDEMARRFGPYPGAVATAAALAEELAFDLRLVAPKLPDFDIPEPGHTEMSWLRKLTYEGAEERYGPRSANPRAYEVIDRELGIIDELGFPGYFLVVYDIVKFCRDNNILCQGRGSAANSAVCYALRITNVDAVRWNMLFDRFLTPQRDGPPDIDVDIESDRREEVIQYVYRKHGRRHAAQVANVISYRPKSAIRDMAKAFGYSPGQQDAWSKQIDRWGSVAQSDVDDDIPQQVIQFANELLTFPRHLGIHSGGMVICDRPVVEVCPVEWARMENRTVLQWDKDDCAASGLVKFDLLGLGMLSALHYCMEFVDPTMDLGDLDLADPEVYEMLCRADAIGVFQVESRAQMATLPRLRPTKFYDLVVEVALIRPGPIQGGSVHPYIRRKQGKEPPTPPHPLLEKALARTLGVPLFQEQLMQMAIDVAGFNPAEADQLRRAMGSKRSMQRMNELKQRLFDGMAARGVTGELAEELFLKLAAFANYGFPESHAMSFASLVFFSAWFKRYHPAAFCAALINAQPMGFYSVQSLVDDARRHGVTVRRPDINASGAACTLEPPSQGEGDRVGPGSLPGARPESWGQGGPVVRLGLSQVRTIGTDLAERIVAEREANGPYHDLRDLARRVAGARLPARPGRDAVPAKPLTTANLEALATADAFARLPAEAARGAASDHSGRPGGMTRRAALWAAAAAAQERPDRLPGTALGVRAPVLPGMDAVEELVADVWATGLAPDRHPVQFVRDYLTGIGALPLRQLTSLEDGVKVLVGGLVTHRQRPATASGITFLNLEDETGMLNVVCSPGLWQRYRRVARSANAMVIRGKLELVDGVTNLVAEHLAPLRLPVRSASRDFR